MAHIQQRLLLHLSHRCKPAQEDEDVRVSCNKDHGVSVCSVHRLQLNARGLFVLRVAPLLDNLDLDHKLVVYDDLRLERVEQELDAVVDVGPLQDMFGSRRLEESALLEMTLGTFEVEAGADVHGFVDDRRDVRFLVLEAGLGFLLVFGVDGVDVPSAAYSKRLEGLGASRQDEGCRPSSESFAVPGPGVFFSVVLPQAPGGFSPSSAGRASPCLRHGVPRESTDLSLL